MSGDKSGDASADVSADGRWLTYEELAQIRGISRPSAERLVLRNRWRRQRDNQRVVRILVPLDRLSDDASDDASADRSADVSPDMSRSAAAFEAALTAIQSGYEGETAALRERAVAAEAARDAAIALADQTVTLLKDATSRADRAETGRDAERARADALADRVHVVQADLAKAEAEGDALRSGRLTAQVKAAKAEAKEAQDRAEELRQAEAARQGRGRLARLRAAWWGE